MRRREFVLHCRALSERFISSKQESLLIAVGIEPTLSFNNFRSSIRAAKPSVITIGRYIYEWRKMSSDWNYFTKMSTFILSCLSDVNRSLVLKNDFRCGGVWDPTKQIDRSATFHDLIGLNTIGTIHSNWEFVTSEVVVKKLRIPLETSPDK